MKQTVQMSVNACSPKRVSIRATDGSRVVGDIIAEMMSMSDRDVDKFEMSNE